MSTESDDDERMWNLIMFKVYATDKEMDEMADSPWTWVIIVVLLVLAFGLGTCHGAEVKGAISKTDADVTYYVTDIKSDADVWVWVVSRNFKPTTTEISRTHAVDWWWFNTANPRKVRLWEVRTKSDADIIVYFVNHRYESRIRRFKPELRLFEK